MFSNTIFYIRTKQTALTFVQMGSFFSKGQTTDQTAEMTTDQTAEMRTEDLVKILTERVAEAIDQLNKKKFELFDNYRSLQGYHGSLTFAINQAKAKGIEFPPFPQFTKFEFENMNESQPVESPEYLSPVGLTQTDMQGLLKHNIDNCKVIASYLLDLRSSGLDMESIKVHFDVDGFGKWVYETYQVSM